jgi:hypothetical protein
MKKNRSKIEKRSGCCGAAPLLGHMVELTLKDIILLSDNLDEGKSVTFQKTFKISDEQYQYMIENWTGSH